MVTYAQLLNMDTTKLSDTAAECGRLASDLSKRGQQVLDSSHIPPDMWEGEDADAASDALQKPPPTLDDASDAFRAAKPILEELVDQLEKAKTKLQDAQSMVAGSGVVIQPDGTVVTPVVQSEAEAKDNDRIARNVRQMIDEAVFAATAADNHASYRLNLSIDEDLGIDSDKLLGKEKKEPGPLDWLNGGWQDRERQEGGLPIQIWDALTAEQYKKNFMGLLSVESKHGGQEGIKATVPTGENGPSLSLGGDPQRSLKFSVLDAELGPISGSLGSLEFNNTLIPGVEWGAGEDGRSRLAPKVNLPGFSLAGPTIGFDLNKLKPW